MSNGTDNTGYTSDELDRLNRVRATQQREHLEHVRNIRAGLLEALHAIARADAHGPYPPGDYTDEQASVLLALESASSMLTVAEHNGLFEGPSDRAMLARFREMDEMGLTGRGNR